MNSEIVSFLVSGSSTGVKFLPFFKKIFAPCTEFLKKPYRKKGLPQREISKVFGLRKSFALFMSRHDHKHDG